MASKDEVISIATELYNRLIVNTTAAFSTQTEVMKAMNGEIRALIDQVRVDVDSSFKNNTRCSHSDVADARLTR